MSWIKNPEKLLQLEENALSRRENNKCSADKNAILEKQQNDLKISTEEDNRSCATDKKKSSNTNTSSVQQKKDKNSTSATNPKKLKDTAGDSVSWVKNPTNLLQSEQNPSNCNKSKNNVKQTLPKATSHSPNKKPLLHLDIIAEIIGKMKSNEEFKHLLQSVSAIMKDKNLKNRKSKINLLESFLDNYKSANGHYMKQLKTIVNCCESQIVLAPYFVDVKDDVTRIDIRYMSDEELISFRGMTNRGVITKDNVKKDIIIKSDNALIIQNEAWVLAQLKHPNIIGLLGYDPRQKVILLEYMDFFGLNEFNTRVFDRNTQITKKILLDMITGMDYVHSKKILHRNLQLQHILFNKNYECKISGFKWAVYVGDSHGEYESSVLHYPLAPEFKDTGKYTYKTDVWSMGDICNIFLTTVRRTREKLEPTNPIMQLNNFVTEKMLASDPHDRMDFSEIKVFIQNIEA